MAELNPFFYILIGAVAVTFVISLTVLIILLRIRSKFRKFMQGAKGIDLEALIHGHSSALDALHKFKGEALAYLKLLDQRIKHKIGMVETVRFNPFQGQGHGGNQSFSSAFVNEEGNGVVISGIYSRDRASVFSKPVSEWQSEYELTEEERKVLESSKIKNQHAK